jgi:hypothetical protein
MKNTFYKILGVAAAVLTVSACNLDLYPYDSIVYDESTPTIQKASDLASFEQGIHTYFRGRHQGTFYYVGDLMADGFNAVADFGNNYGPLHRTDSDFNAGDSDVEGIWGSYYSGINQYNLDIAAANNIADAGLKESAKTFKGYAFFYRAYTYLCLARHFGKAYNPSTAATDLSVPLVLVYDQNARPARDTQETVYKQIKADLDSAAFFLAEVPGQVRAQKPTLDAVKALYARYYLDVKEYAKAAEYATDLIESGTYALATTAKEFLAEYVDDNGTEPIMQMFASLNEAPASLNNYTRLTQTGNEYVYTPYFLPSGKLIDTYDEGDLRLANWFKDAGESSYPIYVSGSSHSNPDVKVFTKFEGNSSYNSVGVPQGQQAIKPFRIGEMYLIAAEALYEGGNTTDALEVLQALQTARGAELTENLTPKAIQDEWFKETVGEGQRTWCLKRWGVGFSARYYQPAAFEEHLLASGPNYADKSMDAGDYHLTLPIPNYEMQINKNLKQNEGYGLLEN